MAKKEKELEENNQNEERGILPTGISDEMRKMLFWTMLCR